MGNKEFEDYLFYTATIKSQPFKLLFEALKNIISEFHLIVKDDKMIVAQVNNHDISAANLGIYAVIDCKSLECFNCSDNKIEIGLLSEDMYKFTKTIKNNECFIMYIKKDKPNKLVLRRDNTRDKFYCNFTIHLKDFEPFVNVDNFITASSFNCHLILNSNKFQKGIKDYLNISNKDKRKDKIHLQFKNNKLSLKSDIYPNEYEMVMNGEEVNKYNDTFSHSFYILHLNTMVKASTINKQIELDFSENGEILAKYNVPGIGSVFFIVSACD